MPTPDSIDDSQNGKMEIQKTVVASTTEASKGSLTSCLRESSPSSSRKPKMVHFVDTSPASNSPQDNWNSDDDEAYMSPVGYCHQDAD